jgi:hypothetical protein
MPVLEEYVESWLMHKIGDRMLPRKITIPAVSHTADLEKAERKITEIDAAYDSGDPPIAAYSRQMTKWESERDRLAALPQLYVAISDHIIFPMR